MLDPFSREEPAWNEFKVGDIVVRIGDLTKYVVQAIYVNWEFPYGRSRFSLLDTETRKLRGEMDGYWMQKEWVKVGNLMDNGNAED